MKTTAVEFLVEMLLGNVELSSLEKIYIEQAKEMEKEQIVEAQEQDKNKYNEEEVRDMLFEALNHKKEECCITHTTDSIVRKIIKEFKNK